MNDNLVARFNEFLVRLRTDLPITDEDLEMLKEVNVFIDSILFPHKSEVKDEKAIVD